MGKKGTIYYVVDSRGWVQHKRAQYLKKYVPHLRFVVLTAGTFAFMWRLGLLRSSYIYFSTWRIVHSLLKSNPLFFKADDYKRFMTSVTSHMNIGGGLSPEKVLAGRNSEDALQRAVAILRTFKVVTVNSLFLKELLEDHISNIVYCPNGVDVELFSPGDNKKYDPDRIRIGWIGKKRTSKNYETIELACGELEKLGFTSNIVIVPKNTKRPPLTPEMMADFYNSIDYYLCASWNEGTPNPALEAGACGVPVVTTRVGNMREIIREGETGFFVEPEAGSIVDKFKSIKNLEPARYQRMSSAIRKEICDNWMWDRQMNNYKKAFDRLIHD